MGTGLRKAEAGRGGFTHTSPGATCAACASPPPPSEVSTSSRSTCHQEAIGTHAALKKPSEAHRSTQKDSEAHGMVSEGSISFDFVGKHLSRERE